jgi:hypothetical protein
MTERQIRLAANYDVLAKASSYLSALGWVTSSSFPSSCSVISRTAFGSSICHTSYANNTIDAHTPCIEHVGRPMVALCAARRLFNV